MQSQALAKSLRISPRKMGVVASLVRGRTVGDALVILEHTPRKAAPILAKVINSAAANARQAHNTRTEDLTIDRLDVTRATSMKRYFSAAHGRARPYLKRSTHVRVVVTAPEKPQPSPKKPVVAGKPAKEKK